MPEAAAGVMLGRAAVARDMAEVKVGAVAVRVYGFWANDGGQSLYVTYTNGGATPIKVRPQSFALQSGKGEAKLYQVIDTTGTDPAAAVVPAGDARRLVNPDAPGGRDNDFVIPAGTKRSLSVGFARFRPEGNDPVVGTQVSARVPMPGDPITVRFICAGAQRGD